MPEKNRLAYIPVAGTFCRNRGDDTEAWYRRNSQIDRLFASRGFDRVEQDNDPDKPDPGYWSGDLGGLMVQGAQSYMDWWKGGTELRKVIVSSNRAGIKGLLVVAHSHGGQAAAYAFAGLGERPKYRTALITVDTPLVRGMSQVYHMARANVDFWLHLHTGWGWGSRMRVLGSKFNKCKLKIADHNQRLRGAHSGILYDDKFYDQWPGFLAMVYTSLNSPEDPCNTNPPTTLSDKGSPV